MLDDAVLAASLARLASSGDRLTCPSDYVSLPLPLYRLRSALSRL